MGAERVPTYTHSFRNKRIISVWYQHGWCVKLHCPGKIKRKTPFYDNFMTLNLTIMKIAYCTIKYNRTLIPTIREIITHSVIIRVSTEGIKLKTKRFAAKLQSKTR